jgi:hypothetical protein
VSEIISAPSRTANIVIIKRPIIGINALFIALEYEESAVNLNQDQIATP